MTGADRRASSMGELLERTFSVYRGHFVLFFGIMILPAVLSSLGGLAQPPLDLGRLPEWPDEVLLIAASLLFSTILGITVHAAGVAAATVAVSEIHQDRRVTVAGCYRRSGRSFPGMLGLSLLLMAMLFAGFAISSLAGIATGVALGRLHTALGALGVPVLFTGMAATTAWLVRYGVAVPALIMESLSPGAALRRSTLVSKGFRARIALTIFLALVINTVVAFVFQGPFLLAEMFLVAGGGPADWVRALKIGSGSIGGGLSGPFLPIGMALVYLEIRGR